MRLLRIRLRNAKVLLFGLAVVLAALGLLAAAAGRPRAVITLILGVELGLGIGTIVMRLAAPPAGTEASNI